MSPFMVLVRYVLTAALRDKVVWGVALTSLLGLCLSIFTASSAIVEQGQFAVVFSASSLRLIALLGLVLFVVFFVRRSFDARDVEYLLTRPLSRAQFVGAHSVAFSVLAVGAGLFIALLVSGMAAYSHQTDGIVLWVLGVVFEYILISNVAFFFAMVLSSPVSSGMATLGFYVLSRLMGQLLGIVHHGGLEVWGSGFLKAAFSVVSMIIPRLDLMTQSSWLIYGNVTIQDWAFSLVQATIFSALVFGATLIDLVRRQF